MGLSTDNEALVSFETAKLLKTKGYKDWCKHCYGTAVLHNGVFIDADEEFELKEAGRGDEIEYVIGGHLCHFGYSNKTKNDTFYAAPTIYEARKWVENEEYLVYAYPQYDGHEIAWRYNIWFDNSHMFLGQILEYGEEETYESFEEAIEAGIRYALKNLI